MREILDPPNSVVNDQRKFNWGCYHGAIKKVNMLDANWGVRPLRNFLLREWQAFQIHNDDGSFVMCALYNTKKFSIVQFIVFDTKTHQKWRYERKVLPHTLQIPNGLFNTDGHYRSKDFNLHVAHDIENNLLTLNAEIKSQGKDLPALKASFKACHDTAQYPPMVVVMPFSKNKGMYSHKCLMPVEGTLELDEERRVFNSSNSSLIIDDHKGYYPFRTRYDWVTAVGFDTQQRRIGFNFTDNQVKDQEKYNENCLWLDGSTHPLNPVKIERPNGCKDIWQVKDIEGAINLTFRPVVHNSVKLNFGLVASEYEGPYGLFNGTIQIPGETVKIEDLFGMGEDFYLRL
jgi:hypothetical protein